MQYEKCLIQAPISTITALLLQDPLNKVIEVSELPGFLDKSALFKLLNRLTLSGLLDRSALSRLLNKPVKTLKTAGFLLKAPEVAGFPFENLDALEVTYKDIDVDFRIDLKTYAQKEHELVYLTLVFPNKPYNQAPYERSCKKGC